MLLRVVIVTFILGIAAFIQLKGTKPLPAASISSVYSIIVATCFLSLLYLALIKKIKNIEVNIQTQATCDALLITVLVFVTGGIRSVYSILYPLVIIYSALFLTRRGGLIVASFISLLYGSLLDLEYYEIIHPIYSAPWDYDFSAGDVLSMIFIHIVSFYIVALLMSFVVEQEKTVRSRLAEKENEFHQLDLLHKSIIESVNTGIATIDLLGNIKSFNRAAEEITGFSFAEVQDRGIDRIFPGFPEILRTIRNKEGWQGGVDRGEITVSGKQDKRIVLGFSVSSLMDSKDKKIGDTLIFQDLTAAKEMEREVESSKRLALIGEMAAGLAHEVRNPLASLSGSIQILKTTLALDETNDRLMQIVLRGRDQLENLVKNFLLLARPSPADREEIDINDIINDVLESLRYGPDWQEKISMEKRLCDGAGVLGNMTEIRQMLWNLAINAVQSMPESGRLTVATRLVPSDNRKEYLEIQIRDTGCGIGKDNTDDAFKPFYTTKDGGTGLGLAIANRIALSHGGKITIESEVKKGTICTLLLPRINAADNFETAGANTQKT